MTRPAKFATQPRECCVRFMSMSQDTKLSKACVPRALRVSQLTAGTIIFNKCVVYFHN